MKKKSLKSQKESLILRAQRSYHCTIFIPTQGHAQWRLRTHLLGTLSNENGDGTPLPNILRLRDVSARS